MIELIYAGVWLAGIAAAWDMVRRWTGSRDYLKVAARLASIDSRHTALANSVRDLLHGDAARGTRIADIERKLPEVEKRIDAVRGMIPPVKRVGLGIR